MAGRGLAGSRELRRCQAKPAARIVEPDILDKGQGILDRVDLLPERPRGFDLVPVASLHQGDGLFERQVCHLEEPRRVIGQEEGGVPEVVLVALDQAVALLPGDVAEGQKNERDPEQAHEQGQPAARQRAAAAFLSQADVVRAR